MRVRRAGDGTLAGILEEVLEASPHRVEPRCPHFGPSAASTRGCGGCTLQHIAYPEQLRLKSGLVTRLVRTAVPGAPTAQPAIPGAPIESPWGYRQKVHFVFDSARATTRAGLTMGHYARGSRRVIPVTTCPVHDDRGNAVAFRFRDALASGDVSETSSQTVRSLAVRVGRGSPEIMATLVLTREAARDVRAACRRATDNAGLAGFHVNIHPRGDGYIFGPVTRRIAGAERMREDVDGVSYLVSPTAFFQTNVHAAGILVGLVLGAAGKPCRVLDLYAGRRTVRAGAGARGT